jgi:DNA-directed RNA polymerase subunit RPC12/RpoP
MRSTITCTACGTVLGVPKSGMPKGGLSCNWCGYVVLAESESPAPDLSPSRGNPTTIAEEPSTIGVQEKAAKHRWADDDDDDGQPYDLPQEEVKTRKCDGCGKEIEVLSIICVHCGFSAEAKERVKRTFAPVDRVWESGWPFQRRMGVFVGFLVLDLISLVVSTSGGGSLPMSIGGILFYVCLQAFLFGTFSSVRIRRNKKGQSEIIVTWRVGFIPMAPKKVEWREFEAVVFGHYDATSIVDWFLFFLLLSGCILPGLFFWFYVIRSDRFFAALARDHDYPETYLYRGMNEVQAKEICQVATDVTGLKLATPL